VSTIFRAGFAIAAAALMFVATTVPQAHASPPAADSCAAPGTDGFVITDDMITAPQGHARPAGHSAADRVHATIDAFVAHANARDYDAAARLFTPYFICSFMGQNSYAGATRILTGLRMEDVRVEDIRGYEDGSFTADARFLAYGHEVAHERWTLWPDPQDGRLKVTDLQPLHARVAPGAATIGVKMGEYFYRLDKTTVCAPDGNVVLRLRNIGEERHEAIVLRLPEGAVPEDLLTGKVGWDQSVPIGHDNHAKAISLTGLDPGTYSLFDFIPAADGRPHATHGQTAQFTVSHC
jgi:hypothetical protein